MGSREEQLVSWSHVTSLMSFLLTRIAHMHALNKHSPSEMFIGKANMLIQTYPPTHTPSHAPPHTPVPATNSPWPSGPVCRWFSEHGPPLMLPPGCQSPQSRNLWLVFTWREAEILSQSVRSNMLMRFHETCWFTTCRVMLLCLDLHP